MQFYKSSTILFLHPVETATISHSQNHIYTTSQASMTWKKKIGECWQGCLVTITSFWPTLDQLHHSFEKYGLDAEVSILKAFYHISYEAKVTQTFSLV